MKKIAIASVAFAAALFAVSCQKETPLAQNISGPMTISAVAGELGTPTKTEMIFKYDVAWSANDKIYVKDASGNHDTFSLQNGAGTTKGSFKQDGDATFTGEVQAYYPETLVQDGSLVWPASQTNDQTIPMYCRKTLSGTTDERMDFRSLGSVLQIVFNSKQENVTLRYIEIKDGEKTMSGAFHVDGNGKAIIDATDKAGITIDFGDSGLALGDGANYFNIAIPAGDYQNLTLTFIADDDAKCTMTGGKVNIEHNTVGRLTLTANLFKPTGTAKRTGGIDVTWVQLWKGGPKFAEYNVGVTDGKVESFGGYYTWGGCIDKDPNASHNIGVTNLIGNHDTAFNLWGSNWRMPTKQEWGELLANCDAEWVYVNNVRCRKFTGRGYYSSFSLLLPVAGRYFNGQAYILNDGIFYWSSTVEQYNFTAWHLWYMNFDRVIGYYLADGMPVRAVLNENPTMGAAGTSEGIDVNWVQLWENGPKFAECNIGVADGNPLSYGNHYSWGGFEDKGQTYNTGDVKLEGDSDTATKVWGSNWRMPTMDELKALFANCDWSYTTLKGDIHCWKFTGKGKYSHNSVVLPAAGYASDGGTYAQNTDGYYWSSEPEPQPYPGAYYLYLGSTGPLYLSGFRSSYYSVRPLLKED